MAADTFGVLGVVLGVGGDQAGHRCLRSSRGAVSPAGDDVLEHVSGIHECLGQVDRPAVSTVMARATSTHGTDWRIVLVCGRLGADRF